MEYRIRKCGHGGFTVEKGLPHEGGARIPGIIGYTMPAFIVYESSHFDTKRQAEAYIRRRQSAK